MAETENGLQLRFQSDESEMKCQTQCLLDVLAMEGSSNPTRSYSASGGQHNTGLSDGHAASTISRFESLKGGEREDGPDRSSVRVIARRAASLDPAPAPSAARGRWLLTGTGTSDGLATPRLWRVRLTEPNKPVSEWVGEHSGWMDVAGGVVRDASLISELLCLR
jgi:hypothetical protein